MGIKKIGSKIGRRLGRAVFSNLPEQKRRELIRSRIQVPTSPDPHIRFKLAETENEFTQAYSLLHDCYVEQRFIMPDKSGMRLLPHFLLPTSVTLIAITESGEVVGTMSIIKSSELSFPMEKVFSIKGLPGKSQGDAEISALAVKRSFRRLNGGSVFFFMLNFMYHYCVSQMHIRRILIVIHPKDEDFYAGLLFFRRIPGQGIVDYLGAPALPMYLDLEEALRVFTEVYGEKPRHKNLIQFFLTEFSNLHYIKRPYMLNSFSTITPEIFSEVFLKRGDFFHHLSFSDFKILKRALYTTNLLPFFHDDSMDELTKRKELRVSAHMKAKAILNDRLIALDVNDVSGEGLGFKFVTEFSNEVAQAMSGRKLGVLIDLGEGIQSSLAGHIVWEHYPKFGFKILAHDANWSDFVEYLYRGKQNYVLKSS